MKPWWMGSENSASSEKLRSSGQNEMKQQAAWNEAILALLKYNTDKCETKTSKSSVLQVLGCLLTASIFIVTMDDEGSLRTVSMTDYARRVFPAKTPSSRLVRLV